jgi:transcriptional regulator with XRE-family HTH domain
MLNRQQLNEASNGWMRQATADLRNKLVELLQENGLNRAQLCQQLGLNADEVSDFLDGSIRISLELFAKVLTLVGEEHPTHRENNCGGGYRGLAREILEDGAEDEIYEEEAHPNNSCSTTPYRDANGRFARRPSSESAPRHIPEPPHGHFQSNEGLNEDFSETEVPRIELLRAIKECELDTSRINLETSTNAELIEFLHQNGIRFGRKGTKGPRSEEASVPNTLGEEPKGLSSNKLSEVKEKIWEAIEQDPRLQAQLEQWLNSKG